MSLVGGLERICAMCLYKREAHLLNATARCCSRLLMAARIIEFPWQLLAGTIFPQSWVELLSLISKLLQAAQLNLQVEIFSSRMEQSDRVWKITWNIKIRVVVLDAINWLCLIWLISWAVKLILLNIFSTPLVGWQLCRVRGAQTERIWNFCHKERKPPLISDTKKNKLLNHSSLNSQGVFKFHSSQKFWTQTPCPGGLFIREPKACLAFTPN